mgnify:CR=1 FL=1
MTRTALPFALLAWLITALPSAASAQPPTGATLPAGVSVDASSLALLTQPGTFDDLHELGISHLRLPIEEYPVDRLDAHRRTAEVRDALMRIAREARGRSISLIGVIGPHTIPRSTARPNHLSDPRTRAHIVHVTVDAARLYDLHAIEVWPHVFTSALHDSMGDYARLVIELREGLDAQAPEVKIILPWVPEGFDPAFESIMLDHRRNSHDRLPFEAVIIHASGDAPFHWSDLRQEVDLWIADLGAQPSLPICLLHSISTPCTMLGPYRQASELISIARQFHDSVSPPHLYLYAHYLDPEPRESQDPSEAPSTGLRHNSLSFYHRKPIWYTFSDVAHAREPSIDLLQIHGTRRPLAIDSEGAP